MARLLLVLLLAGCSVPAYHPDPWEEGAVVEPPRGCQEARARGDAIC